MYMHLREVPEATFFIIYIGCTPHVNAAGEVSGATLFIIYIGCTAHVYTAG
jgi:cbb3-type cytochrome oxidase subunit 3